MFLHPYASICEIRFDFCVSVCITECVPLVLSRCLFSVRTFVILVFSSSAASIYLISCYSIRCGKFIGYKNLKQKKKNNNERTIELNVCRCGFAFEISFVYLVLSRARTHVFERTAYEWAWCAVLLRRCVSMRIHSLICVYFRVSILWVLNREIWDQMCWVDRMSNRFSWLF